MNRLCADIQAQAAGLASLAPGDRERRAAETHALTCASCAAALAEGTAVLSLVDEALPLGAPQPEMLARARREILAELAAGSPPSQRPQRRRGRFRPSATAVAPLTAVPALAVALALLKGGAAGLQAPIGIKCAAIELAVAAGPLVIAFALARRRQVSRSIIAVAMAAAGGALVGQAALHVACHALPSTSHAFVFHALPVMLALALGALAGLRLQPGAGRPPARRPT